jgi:hypothetical protein
MGAAINEPDPSFSRWFVEPAMKFFGRRRVRAALLEFLKMGSMGERVGRCSCVVLDEGEEGRGGWLPSKMFLTSPLNGVRLQLREFVRNEDEAIRYQLVGYLHLDSPEEFAPDLRDLVSVALGILSTMTR